MSKTEFHKDILKIKDIEDLIAKITAKMREDVMGRHKRFGGVIGLSGGIDSSVCMALAVIAEKAVESLVERIARRADLAQAPFAEGSGDVSLFLEQAGDGHSVLRQRQLAPETVPASYFGIVAYVRVSAVFAGYQVAASRGADGRACIIVGEQHALRCQ